MDEAFSNSSFQISALIKTYNQMDISTNERNYFKGVHSYKDSPKSFRKHTNTWSNGQLEQVESSSKNSGTNFMNEQLNVTPSKEKKENVDDALGMAPSSPILSSSSKKIQRLALRRSLVPKKIDLEDGTSGMEEPPSSSVLSSSSDKVKLMKIRRSLAPKKIGLEDGTSGMKEPASTSVLSSSSDKVKLVKIRRSFVPKKMKLEKVVNVGSSCQEEKPNSNVPTLQKKQLEDDASEKIKLLASRRSLIPRKEEKPVKNKMEDETSGMYPLNNSMSSSSSEKMKLFTSRRSLIPRKINLEETINTDTNCQEEKPNAVNTTPKKKKEDNPAKREPPSSPILSSSSKKMKRLSLQRFLAPKKINLEQEEKPEKMRKIYASENIAAKDFHSSTSSISVSESQNLEGEENNLGSIPSVVEKFLENALGSEANVTVADDKYLETSFNSSTTFNDSKRSRLNSTLNLPKSLYQSFSKNFKKKMESSKKKEKPQEEKPDYPRSPETEARRSKLMVEYDNQQKLIDQASKALQVCLANENLIGTSQHVETERILLTNILQKQALRAEFDNLAKSDFKQNFHGLGEITLKNLSLDLREIPLDDKSNEWFVISVRHGSTIRMSQSVRRTQISATINFPEAMNVPNVTPDFKLELKVYGLNMKAQMGKRDIHSKLICPFSKTVVQIVKKNNAKNQSYDLANMFKSSFRLVASLELSLNDLNVTSPWPLKMENFDTYTKGSLNMTLICKMYIEQSQIGFVTHGTESGGYTTWNRRWCILDQHTLKFWDYPQDQEADKSPLLSINLMNCTSDKISNVDRAICPRRRTLLIETASPKHPRQLSSNMPAFVVRRNFLGCDNQDELEQWTEKINNALAALYEWKVKKQPSGSISPLRLQN